MSATRDERPYRPGFEPAAVEFHDPAGGPEGWPVCGCKDRCVTCGGPESVLEEAQRLVHGARQAAYGHPAEDYARTGRLWSAVLDGWLRSTGWTPDAGPLPDIPPRIACLMMVQVKVSREVNAPRRDNRVDGAGYFECAELCAQREQGPDL